MLDITELIEKNKKVPIGILRNSGIKRMKMRKNQKIYFMISFVWRII